MTRFRLTVEFDGRPFMGWQRQAHGPSVQQAIEEAVKAITGEEAVLHADEMNRAAQVLVGRHDFTTFRSAHCQAESPVKTLDRMTVRRLGEVIEVDVSARSFLHHQVRSMVGCLELVGRGKWDRRDLKDALEAKDRAALGFNAPPDGLYFVEAMYPGETWGMTNRR